MESKVQSEREFDCSYCCNKRTPLCDKCTVVQATDGTVSKPKYFVRLSDEEIHVIKEQSGADMLEDLALYIVRSVELGVPIPTALVMLWNRKTEARS